MALPSCLCVAGRPPFDRLNDIYCAVTQVDVTCVIPEVVSAEINGVTLTVTFSTQVTGGIGFTGLIVGTPAQFSYLAGSGTHTLVLTSDTSAEEGDVVTLDYAPGNVTNRDCPLEAFTDFPVTNNTGLQFTYVQPDGFAYFQPDGVSLYLQP